MEEIKKELYSFDVFTTKEVEKPEKKIIDGEEVTVTRKVKEETPTRVVIRKPSRRILEEADLEYSSEISRCIKKDILTKEMLVKKYADTGGVLTEEEQIAHARKYKRISDLRNELIKMIIVEKKDEAHEQKINKTLDDISSLHQEIAKTEAAHSHLFENTADSIALRHQILFYVLHLTCLRDSETGELIDYFSGASFKDKKEDYYSKEDDPDDLYIKLISKVTYFISFWRSGLANSEEDFKKLEEDLEKESDSETIKTKKPRVKKAPAKKSSSKSEKD